MEKPISIVTGSTGFVGSHLVDLLLEKGHEVRCITRKTSNLRWLKNKNVKIFDVGLDNSNDLEPIVKDADYIYHVAGVVKAKTKEGYFKGNVEATKNLLEAIKKTNNKVKHIIVVSSQTACGPSLDGKPCNEETKPHPITTYGKSN